MRPIGWRPYVKPTNPGHDHYRTPEWRQTRARIKKRDHYRCVRTDCPTPDRGYGGRVIVNHKIPRSEGGTDADGNLETLCPTCDNRFHAEKGGHNRSS
jgi:5-methylcytosine-specific restriction endonuclease McrA